MNPLDVWRGNESILQELLLYLTDRQVNSATAEKKSKSKEMEAKDVYMTRNKIA